ncbi:MAG: hypothetical protein ACRDS9_08465, partial [Pseudonocardiaceae bacterium]
SWRSSSGVADSGRDCDAVPADYPKGMRIILRRDARIPARSKLRHASEFASRLLSTIRAPPRRAMSVISSI